MNRGYKLSTHKNKAKNEFVKYTTVTLGLFFGESKWLETCK